MIDKKILLGNLNAFYGQLLTNNQQKILNFYCCHDLSLGEIAENLHISRQAVYDTIKRAEKQLMEYERKLKLLDKFSNAKDKINSLRELLDNLSIDLENNLETKYILDKINEMKNLTSQILDESF